MKKCQTVYEVGLILVAAALSALGLHIFVNPAGFAPSGIDGVAMMLQRIIGINFGYISLALNIPLLCAAWFFINKKYVIYTAAFTITSSVLMIVLEKVEMYQYVTQNNGWIAVLASGVMLGVRTAIMIKIGGSSGGVDIIACIIQRKRPYMNIESVIMSAAQMLIFNVAMDNILKTSRNAVEARIITDNPDAFKEDILLNLKHGATITDGVGMFTGESKKIIVTIINLRQMSDLIKLSRRHPNSFIYFSEVRGVWGNFRWNKNDIAK